MINIHLANDEKFINPFKLRFDKLHLNNSYYFIDAPNASSVKYFKFIKNSNVKIISFEDDELINSILKCINNEKYVNIFIHYLDFKKAKIINRLKKKYNIKTYWIFYGADLYNRLYKKGKYELYDRNTNDSLKSFSKTKLRSVYYYFKEFKQERAIKRAISGLDYFCFWNPYDLKLLRENYKTKASYKLFIYDSFGLENLSEFKKKEGKTIALVNHSASLSGNHISILSKLKNKEFHSSISKIIIPLNYGTKSVINKVHNYALDNFNLRYLPLLNFLPSKEYYNLLQSVDVAFFGHRRQEAGGNIIYLIGCGAKIFLRQDNSLIKHFKNLGISVYNFDKEFTDEKSLTPLSSTVKENNRKIVLNNFSETAVDDMYLNLI